MRRPDRYTLWAFCPKVPRGKGGFLAGLAGLLFVFCLTSGCGGRYELGRHSAPPFRSIYVKPVSNESFAPQLHALLSGKITEKLAHNGAVRISGEDRADATLEVVVRDYSRDVAATRPEDTVIAAKLNLNLVAFCTLTDNRTGKVYFRDREIWASSHIYPEHHPTEDPFFQSALQSEYQSMPIIADDLARDISRTILETW